MKQVHSTNFDGSPTSPAAGPAQTAKTRLLRDVNERLAERDKGLPVWIRAPKGGLEHYSGFSRSALYALADEGKIRTVSMKAPGKLRGSRLFHLGSIFLHIEKCEANAATEGGK